MDDLGDLSDPVVLTGILTFTTALLSFITCAVLLLCYLLRSVKVDISVTFYIFYIFLGFMIGAEVSSMSPSLSLRGVITMVITGIITIIIILTRDNIITTWVLWMSREQSEMEIWKRNIFYFYTNILLRQYNFNSRINERCIVIKISVMHVYGLVYFCPNARLYKLLST